MISKWFKDDILLGATSYVYFQREWMDGWGYDVSMWWRSPNQAPRYFCCDTGDVAGPTEPTVLADVEIQEKAYSRILDRARQLGALEFSDQLDRIAITHFCDAYAFKFEDGSSHRMIVAGGIHGDKRVKGALGLIFEYARQQTGVRR